MAWDPQTYLRFGAQRTRPAVELLSRVDMDAPASVVDLGCGPGNSTALLAARWPRAKLTGVDASQEMLDEAATSGVRAKWQLADAAQWKPDAPCDVMFSNATLQWIADHKNLLPRLIGHVAPGGVFAFQVPVNFSEPCHTLIQDVAKAGPWAKKLNAVRDYGHVQTAETYFDILEPHAANIDIWETRYLQVLHGEDAVFHWMRGTGLRPFAAALDGDEREAFLEQYRVRVARAYPMRKSGVTLYPFQRLFVVARKS
jgi:trans-aconitate 2-methyltransferase